MNFHIVSSSHWDREWYEPFQKYRLRLVRMFDALLDTLENNPNYKSFHSDGQTILLQDYLQIRPENESRLKALISNGKIEIGPWYTMPDEWIPSGESLIKNLQTGIKICDEFGVKPSPCGYMCDLFGHNSQMPQIFRQFGLKSTAFFRGVEKTHKNLFRWIGADGSSVIAYNMHRDFAYSSFYYLLRFPFNGKEFDKQDIIHRFELFLQHEQELGNIVDDNVLLMDGVDHIDPETFLPQLLDWLREAFPEHKFIHSNMDEYLKAVSQKEKQLEKVQGCLYDVAQDGAITAVLKNCLSSVTDQKQDNSYCETGLELIVSPLNFHLMNTEQKQPDRHFRSVAPYNPFFEQAWNLIIQNHAHDSICGCSASSTHLDTKNRFKNARDIIEATQKNILNELAENVDTQNENYDGAWLIYNHGQKDINGISVAELPLPVSENGTNLRIYDANGTQLDYSILSCKRDFNKESVFNCIIAFPESYFLKTALPLQIPACGYQVLFYKVLKNTRSYIGGQEEFYPPYRFGGSMQKSAMTFDTGKITVTVQPNGTLNVTNNQTGKEYKNLLSFEDCADVGDGWNYQHPAFDSAYTTLCGAAEVSVENDTTFSAVLRITHRMNLPICADAQKRSNEKTEFVFDTFVTLLKDSEEITVRTEVNNTIINHRLRAVFPTGLAATQFSTQLPFDYYSWDIKKRDNTYSKEYDSGVNPNQGAVSVTEGRDTFAVFNKGLYEAAVADDTDRTLYLTLFRSFTNEVVAYTKNGLGAMKGNYTFEYAMAFLTDADNSEIIQRANAFKTGLSVRETKIHGGTLSMQAQAAKIDGKAILSLLQANVKIGKDTYNEIRIYDIIGGDCGTISFLKPVQKAWKTDLLGTITEECTVVDGKIQYSLNNREITTIIFQF